jgi:hypothetical protein
MILDSRNSDGFRRMLRSGQNICGLLDGVTDYTLVGLMDFLATGIESGDANTVLTHIRKHSISHRESPLTAIWKAWQASGDDETAPDIHGTRHLEFYRLRRREDQNSLAFQLFQERFVRTLKAANFTPSFANALAGALVEMTDNVIQHSRREPGEFAGIAGYNVIEGYMAFAVADVGQGVLSSLRRAPQWQSLQTAENALTAAVCQNASSRPDQPIGEGFRTLFKSLADRNCLLRFRSDDAVLKIVDVGNYRDGTTARSPQLRGLQLSVCCSLKGRADEKPINRP